MNTVVLDTDVLIDLLRGRAATRRFVIEATDRALACCSAVSVAEVHAGMRPEEVETTAVLLDSLVTLPVTRSIAELAGSFKRRDRRRTLELADCLVAATAVTEGAPLATGNIKDDRTPEVTLLPARR